MPLKLIDTQAAIEWFPIYFDLETQNPWPVDDNNAPISPNSKMDKAEFGLKRLSTRDMSRISNELYSMDRKGQSKFQYGTASEGKILAACKVCKNVGEDDDPNSEIEFKRSILHQLPNWVSDKLMDHINEVNNLTEVEERD